MRKIIKIIFISIVSVSLLFSALFGCIVFSGYWLLKRTDSPKNSDAIIILGGELTRSFYAADLYLNGYASKIYISRPRLLKGQILLKQLNIAFPREEELNKQVLLKKGVADKDILIFGNSSISTVEESEELKEIFKGKNRRLLIVTSPYSVRRAKMIFENKIKDAEIIVVPTPYEELPKKWWTDRDSAQAIVLEVSKIIFYKLGGSFHSKDKAG